MLTNRFRAVAALLAAAFFLVACPMGPFSGGRLGGAVHIGDVVGWGFVNETELCQIETNPEKPYSVNTWCVGYDEHLYVPSSMILGPTKPTEREWVRNVQTDPRVRVRIESRVYERTVVKVVEELEYAAVRSALEEKYELDPADRDPEREIWIFRMEDR